MIATQTIRIAHSPDSDDAFMFYALTQGLLDVAGLEIRHVLQDIELTVGRGEVVVVIGPSGSGKSTLCRAINRLEAIHSGEILLDGTVRVTMDPPLPPMLSTRTHAGVLLVAGTAVDGLVVLLVRPDGTYGSGFATLTSSADLLPAPILHVVGNTLYAQITDPDLDGVMVTTIPLADLVQTN